MSELRTRLLQHTMKPEEIAGDADTKHRRVVELVRWMVRYNEGNANPKWLAEHATESRLYVDHCHISNRVRGLLCRACNTMLGAARDRAETLRSGAAYLER